jgi:gamma-glutamylcyclotransferase (GGCT)/AIG2-like uncharacterized protein YtfP
MLYFAYGSNMSRVLMGRRCAGAQPLGQATLAGWRFTINLDGYGAIVPRSGGCVRGVLWRLSMRHLAALNAYEGVDTGRYSRRMMAVRHGDRQVTALIYMARAGGEGRPRPSYVHVVVQAARDWQLPESYVRSLVRWSPTRWRGARARDTGELG